MWPSAVALFRRTEVGVGGDIELKRNAESFTFLCCDSSFEGYGVPPYRGERCLPVLVFLIYFIVSLGVFFSVLLNRT